MKVKTPCIGVCSTGIGDQVCRGCKRFIHEVIDWNRYSESEQLLVLQRLDQFLVQIVNNKITIVDPQRLQQKLHYQQISVDPEASPARWLYELLRAGAGQIDNPEAYGFRLQPQWQRFSLEQIKQFLEQDFYTLSCAHYERYIAP